MDIDFPGLEGKVDTCRKCNRRIHSEIDRKIQDSCHPTTTDLLLDGDISLR